MQLIFVRSALVACLLTLVSALPSLPGRPGAALAQTVTPIGGTGVALVPPKGMVPAKGFAGFEHAATGASLLVAEFPPEAFAQIVTTFTPEGVATSGLKASGAAVDWKVAGGTGGRLIRGKQSAHGIEFRKWLLLAKGPATTVLLSVQVPEEKIKVLSEASVEAALKTVTLKKPPSLDEQAGALPFRLGDRAGFRLVRVLAGSGLLLTDGPRDTITDASQPVVIVASALSAVDADDAAKREAIAQQAFATIAGVSDVTIASQTAEEKDGANWSRIEGRGTYRDSMEAVSTLQLMRFDKTGYIRVVAIVRSLDKDKIFPRVEELAASIAPK